MREWTLHGFYAQHRLVNTKVRPKNFNFGSSQVYRQSETEPRGAPFVFFLRESQPMPHPLTSTCNTADFR